MAHVVHIIHIDINFVIDHCHRITFVLVESTQNATHIESDSLNEPYGRCSHDYY